MRQISGNLKNGSLRKVKLDPEGRLFGIEITAYRISDHRLQFPKSVSLSRNPASLGIVPTRDVPGGFWAELHRERNLFRDTLPYTHEYPFASRRAAGVRGIPGVCSGRAGWERYCAGGARRMVDSAWGTPPRIASFLARR